MTNSENMEDLKEHDGHPIYEYPQEFIDGLAEANSEFLFKGKVIATELTRKVVKGKETYEPCIGINVEKKLPDSELSEKDRLPKKINGCLVDVTERDFGEDLAGTKPGEGIRPKPPLDRNPLLFGTYGMMVKRGEKNIS